jgi:oxalate decarboxylase
MSIANQTSDSGIVSNRPTPAFGNPDLPPQGRVNTAGNLESLRSDGPHNDVIESQFPSQIDPPATDISTQPFFWSSFNISPKRIQNGGWARELTSQDFAISEEIAGVNMHLAPGGIRELHWHQTAEWAVMTRGRCRITTIDFQGRPSVDDVEEGDLWYFPAGLPHSLQGLGPEGAEFVLAFDSGKQSESNTLLVTDWIAHTPPEVLAKNFGVPQDVFKNIPLNNLWIFQGDEPGDLATGLPPPFNQTRSQWFSACHALNRSGKIAAAASRSPTAPISLSPKPSRQLSSLSRQAECGRCTGTRTPTSGFMSSAARGG